MFKTPCLETYQRQDNRCLDLKDYSNCHTWREQSQGSLDEWACCNGYENWVGVSDGMIYT